MAPPLLLRSCKSPFAPRDVDGREVLLLKAADADRFNCGICSSEVAGVSISSKGCGCGRDASEGILRIPSRFGASGCLKMYRHAHGDATAREKGPLVVAVLADVEGRYRGQTR